MMPNVSLFASCFNEALFPDTLTAAVEVLERVGTQVDFPRSQTCCGQIHVNTGFAETAIPLVSNMVRTFSKSDTIVTVSGSCTAMVKEHYPALAKRTKDPHLLAEVERISGATIEFSQYLSDVVGVANIGAYFPKRVAYHPTCHSLRSLHVYDSVISLLSSVDSIEIVEIPFAEQCCGFGGTFAVKNVGVSSAMLTDKLANIGTSSAEVVVALDNSCLMHIGGGLKRQGKPISVMHIAEVLANTRANWGRRND